MTAATLLSRLVAVRRTGNARWIARCPAHVDRTPSLAIRELDDGRVLAHCFAGCAAEDVVSAAGLTLADLMPERAIGDHIKRERRPFSAHDILACVAHEALIVALMASDIGRGMAITDAARERVMLASSRLSAAAEIGDT